MDLCFKYRMNGQTRVLAIIEFKRGGYIKTKEFGDALCEEGEEENKKEELDREDEDSCIEENTRAWWMYKQAKTYCDTHDTTYSAIFDYQSLVLHNTAGPYGGMVTVVKPKEFRKALLGYLLDAADKHSLT